MLLLRVQNRDRIIRNLRLLLVVLGVILLFGMDWWLIRLEWAGA